MQSIELDNKKIKIKSKIILCTIFSLIISIIVESISRSSFIEATKFFYTNKGIFLANYLIVFIILLPSILTNKPLTYMSITSLVLIMIGSISFFINLFRGTPLVFTDFYLIKDGVSIAKNYITVESIFKVSIIILIFIFCIYIISNLERNFFYYKKNKYDYFYMSMIIFISPIIKNLENNNILNPNQYDLRLSYNENGFMYSYLNSYIAFKNKKPSLYNRNSIDEIKDSMKKVTYSEVEQKPNIIFIQLEAVMDPKRITNLEITKDPIKNIRRLSKNYSSGKLKVPTYGGSTARTEFEILTGMSLKYMSPGEIPHASLLKKKPIESIAYNLKKANYNSTLIHNFEGNFYERNKVYENLGFDRYISMEYMYGIIREGTFPKDEIILDNIKEILEKDDTPQFIYGIGVQTHGGYDESYINQNSEYKCYGEFPQNYINQMNDYINELAEVDKFIGELVEYIEILKEPTVLVVFSDHLPQMQIVSSEVSEYDKYNTEYFIYDNIGLKTIDKDIDAYQLSTYILNKIGLEGGLISNIHNFFSNTPNYEKILELIQYDILYGKDYISSKKYKKTNLKMGIEPIYIENVIIEGDVFKVSGNGFNEFSCIYVNDKKIDSIYIDKENMEGEFKLTNEQKIQIKQLGKNNIPIGETNIFYIN